MTSQFCRNDRRRLPLQGAWAGSPDRPVAAAGSLRQPAAAADREPDRRPQARQAALGRPQDPRTPGPPTGRRIRVPARSTIHAVLDRHGLVKRLGRPRQRATGTPLSPAPPQRSVVRRLQGRVQARQRPILLSAHRHRPRLALPAAVRSPRIDPRRPAITAFEQLFPERGLP